MVHTLWLVGVVSVLMIAFLGLTSATTIDCGIHLSLSPLARNAAESYLQINWGPKCFPPPTWIGLYHENPMLHDVQQPDYYVQTEDLPTGSHTTDVVLGDLQLPANWERNNAIQHTAKPNDRSPICLPFYIVAFNASNRIQTVDCLKLQPQWMSSLESMWNAPLRSIFIPGTHCSGCFPNRFSGRTMLLNKFGYSQNFDVWTQLVMGVRHLDLKIGYKTHRGPHLESLEFWAVHDSLYVTPLTEILRDIQQFVQLTGELVLVDFREFPIGFYNHPKRHVALVELIKSQLGHLSFKRNNTMNALASGDLSMAEMRDCGRMILITYNEASVVEENSMLWTPWKQYSTKSLKTNEYQLYFEKAFARKDLKDFSWVLTAVQSVESAYTSNGNHLPTSRERAAAINGNITSWLSGSWSHSTNVVSTDFVWSTNLIDLAIQTNNHKQWPNVYDVFIMQ